jgi:hypothetical protein
MSRVLARIHNPTGRECGCLPDCWCRRTAVGRAFRWYGRYFGLRHKSATPEWKRQQGKRV